MTALLYLRSRARRAGKLAALVAIGIVAVPIAIGMLVASCMKDGR